MYINFMGESILRTGPTTKDNAHAPTGYVLPEKMRNSNDFPNIADGYSKTQVLSSFLTNTNVRVIWVEIIQRDNISSKFWSDFSEAVRCWDNVLGYKMQQCGFPRTQAEIELFLQDFSNAVQGNPVALVVDKYHILQTGEVRSFIGNLAAREVEHLSVILLSEGLMLHVQDMVHFGQVVRISDRHLCYTLRETEHYFQSLGYTLTGEQLEDIFRFTQGQSFSVYLIGLCLGQDIQPDQDLICRTLPLINDMLERDFFSSYPPSIQKMLITLSLLGNFTAELIQAVTGVQPEDIIEFVKTNPFVTYDPHTDRFAFYNLFQSFLEKKQILLRREERITAYATAAQWHQRYGDKAKAVSLYLLCDDYEKMYVLILQCCGYQLPFEEATRVIDLLSNVPEEFIARHPMATVIEGIMHYSRMEFEKAWRIIDSLRQDLEQREHTPELHNVLGEIYLMLAIFSMAKCNCDFVGYFRKSSELLPNGSTLVGPEARFVGGGTPVVFYTPEPGSLQRTVDALSEAESFAEQVLNGCGHGLIPLAKSETAFYQGNFKDAERYAFEAIGAARSLHQWDVVCSAYYLLLRTSFSLGNFSDAIWYFTMLQENAKSIQGAFYFPLPEIASSWSYLKLGLPQLVPTWIQVGSLRKKHLLPVDIGRERTIRAEYLLLTQRIPELTAYLSENLPFFWKKGRLFQYLKLQSIKAVVFHIADNKDEAAKALHEAYRLACDNNILMPLVELGSYMRNLTDCLRGMEGHGIPTAWLDTVNTKASTFAKRQVMAKKLYQSRQSNAVNPIDRLTKREKQVLDCLCQGLTRKEISDILEISLNTVKSTIQSIYNKLGAVNRADAVYIASNTLPEMREPIL